MLIRNGKTIQFVRENSMLDIQQLLGLIKEWKVNYMLPCYWNRESFSDYVRRMQGISKKTKLKRNRRQVYIIKPSKINSKVLVKSPLIVYTFGNKQKLHKG